MYSCKLYFFEYEFKSKSDKNKNRRQNKKKMTEAIIHGRPAQQNVNNWNHEPGEDQRQRYEISLLGNLLCKHLPRDDDQARDKQKPHRFCQSGCQQKWQIAIG